MSSLANHENSGALGHDPGCAASTHLGAVLADSHAWHHVEDTSMGEDACKVRYGYGPDNLAVLRAVALMLLS